MSSPISRERKGDRKQQRAWEIKGEKPPSARPSEPSLGRTSHLVAGASSPSRFGPFPHPQGPSCHQSSCRLRACKRLQQMWEGGRGGVPRGPLVRTRPGSAASPPPGPHQCSHTCTHTHTHTYTQARPPASQATDSQTGPLPNWGGACSISESAYHPQSLLGGKTTPTSCSQLWPFLLPFDRAAPSCQGGQSRCKETGG